MSRFFQFGVLLFLAFIALEFPSFIPKASVIGADYALALIVTLALFVSAVRVLKGDE